MRTRVERRTVDLSAYSELVVIFLGMRWYWKDFESMERRARTELHRRWWRNFLRDSGGTGFGHETYCMRGGMKAVCDDVTRPTGMQVFPSVIPARGPMFSARRRLGKAGETPAPLDGMAEREIC